MKVKQNGTRSRQSSINQNMLGAYGEWASGLNAESVGSLSFRNAEWKDMDSWKKAAKEKTCELLARPVVGAPQNVKQLRKYQYDGLEVEEIVWSLPYGPPTAAVFLKPADSEGRLPGILALHDHGGVKYFGKRKIINTGVDVHPLIRSHQDRCYGGRAWANDAAKRGYAVLVSDVFPFGSRRILPTDVPANVLMKMMSHPIAGQLRGSDSEQTNDGDAGKIAGWLSVSSQETEEEIAAYNAFAAQHEHIIAKSLL